MDVQRDAASVRQQVASILRREPPSADIDTLWFGLFDTLDDSGGERIGYYVAGVRGFDADDPDSLCLPAWWPEERYLSSAALAAIKSAEVEAGRRGASDEREFLGYAGQLGAALLVTRFGVSELLGARRLVVGFDSGDYVEVGMA